FICCVFYLYHFFFMIPPLPPRSLFPYTTLFRSAPCRSRQCARAGGVFSPRRLRPTGGPRHASSRGFLRARQLLTPLPKWWKAHRSEEHTSELQSRFDLVCRLLLETKNTYVTLSV